MVINYAHRGASGYYPENTMISFEKAIEMGCSGIETDVQMTSDGELVLIHDEMVNRTTNGTGFVKDYSFRNLRKLDAGSWFKSKYKNNRIPAAEELILLAKQNDIIINFEIKTGLVMYPNIEEKLIDLICKHNMQDKVILSSFNHYSMVTCKEIKENIKTGLLYMEGLYKPEIYCKNVGADAIHPPFYAVNEDIVNEAKKEGILVNPYTVDEEVYMQVLIMSGVDGIITNYPDRLNKLLGGKK